MIVILEYEIGNVSSIQNMLHKIGVPSVISSDLDTIAAASKIILPGVGHFDYCMQKFNQTPFKSLLHKKVMEEGTPLLGICVGHQMLFESSEEGNERGLGWLPGKVVRFKQERMPVGYKIPHMGWTDIHPQSSVALFEGIEEPRYYFVHSYHVECAEEYVAATAHYGYEFVASVQRQNIRGVQFHPEKSHTFGMQFFQNFAQNQPITV